MTDNEDDLIYAGMESVLADLFQMQKFKDVYDQGNTLETNIWHRVRALLDRADWDLCSMCPVSRQRREPSNRECTKCYELREQFGTNRK